jgi:hypothetical protein
VEMCYVAQVISGEIKNKVCGFEITSSARPPIKRFAPISICCLSCDALFTLVKTNKHAGMKKNQIGEHSNNKNSEGL